jgi:phenylacetate-CoA ligase
VLLSSETSDAQARAEISDAFGCPVTDYYGSAEQAAFMAQCRLGSYHVHGEYGIVEFIPVGQEGGETLFEIVATSFQNWATPLIRYRTGDLVTLGEGPCECGCPGPWARRIAGRLYHLIMTPEGRFVAGIGPALKGFPLRESQLVQVSPDTVEFRCVPAHQPLDDSTISAIQERLRQRLGPLMKISIRTVDSIPRGPNGKFAMTLNLLQCRAVSASASQTELD